MVYMNKRTMSLAFTFQCWLLAFLMSASAAVDPTLTIQRELTGPANPVTIFNGSPISPAISQNYKCSDSGVCFNAWLTTFSSNSGPPTSYIYSPQLQQTASVQMSGTVRFIEMLDGMRALRHILAPILELLPFQVSSGSIAIQTPVQFQSYGAVVSTGVIAVENTS